MHTAFIVEKGMKGFSTAQKLDKSACADPTPASCFSRIANPPKRTVGEVNHGVKVLMSGLNTERLVLSGGPSA